MYKIRGLGKERLLKRARSKYSSEKNLDTKKFDGYFYKIEDTHKGKSGGC